MQRKPTDYLRHIYYDCITYDQGALNYLVSVVGAERVLFGTDWPHQVFDIKGAFVRTGTFTPTVRDAMRSGNARRIFGI
jgi:aminocarboxymuconate-semialdehyde decarboxylase